MESTTNGGEATSLDSRDQASRKFRLEIEHILASAMTATATSSAALRRAIPNLVILHYSPFKASLHTLYYNTSFY